MQAIERQRTKNEKEMTTPLAWRGPAARRRGPHIVTKLQHIRQKDRSRIRWNATKVSSLKKKVYCSCTRDGPDLLLEGPPFSRKQEQRTMKLSWQTTEDTGSFKIWTKKFWQAQSLEHCRKEGRNEGSVPFAVHLRQTKLQTRMFRVAKTFD